MALSPGVPVSEGAPTWERPFSADTCLGAFKVAGRRYYASDVWPLVKTLQMITEITTAARYSRAALKVVPRQRALPWVKWTPCSICDAMHAQAVASMSPSRVNSYLYHLGVIDFPLGVRLHRPEIISAVPGELLVLWIDLVRLCQ